MVTISELKGIAARVLQWYAANDRLLEKANGDQSRVDWNDRQLCEAYGEVNTAINTAVNRIVKEKAKPPRRCCCCCCGCKGRD